MKIVCLSLKTKRDTSLEIPESNLFDVQFFREVATVKSEIESKKHPILKFKVNSDCTWISSLSHQGRLELKSVEVFAQIRSNKDGSIVFGKFIPRVEGLIFCFDPPKGLDLVIPPLIECSICVDSCNLPDRVKIYCWESVGQTILTPQRQQGEKTD